MGDDRPLPDNIPDIWREYGWALIAVWPLIAEKILYCLGHFSEPDDYVKSSFEHFLANWKEKLGTRLEGQDIMTLEATAEHLKTTLKYRNALCHGVISLSEEDGQKIIVARQPRTLRMANDAHKRFGVPLMNFRDGVRDRHRYRVTKIPLRTLADHISLLPKLIDTVGKLNAAALSRPEIAEIGHLLVQYQVIFRELIKDKHSAPESGRHIPPPVAGGCLSARPLTLLQAPQSRRRRRKSSNIYRR